MLKYFGIGALAILTACTTTPQNPRDVIQGAGYMTTVPPTKNYGPGNLVWKKNNQFNKPGDVTLGYICSPEFVKFPGAPEASASENLDFGHGKEFKFTADNLQAIGLAASAQYVDSFTMRFTNTEVQEYGLDKVGMITDSLGDTCKKILRTQIAKKNAYAVLSAFKADLDYVVTYKADASAAAKVKVGRELQAEFGVANDGNSGRVGKGLFYGVYLQKL